MNTKLVESLVQIIQSLSEEERLLLYKKLVTYLPNFSDHETQTDFDNLAQALAELRQICAEENYTIEVPPRQDRSNPFAESLNEIPV
jgi:sigma54-dependent transcription regulator